MTQHEKDIELIRRFLTECEVKTGQACISEHAALDRIASGGGEKVEGLDEAILYFESDDEKRKQDGKLDYINFEDRLQKILKAARLYASNTGGKKE